MQSNSVFNTIGFIDAHVHLLSKDGIACAAEAGISCIRDAGMGGAESSATRNWIHDKGTIVISSLRALYKRGGYGVRFGIAVDTETEIKAEILKLKKEGADIIKVMASGIVSLKDPGSITAGGFNREELRYIVDEAAALDLGVMAHANGEAAIIAAAEAGARSVEHGFFMTEQCLDVMARKGTYWTPTTDALARVIRASIVPDEARRYLTDIISRHVSMIRHAFDAGVPLTVGTDAVLPNPDYREIYHRELAFFEQAGLTSHDVMTIASEGGARLLGIKVPPFRDNATGQPS